MKKINTLLLASLFLFFFFTGCSDDDAITPPDDKQEEINPMEAYIPLKSKPAANKKDLLGKGYDYTGAYASDSYVRESIIDFEKYKNDSQFGYSESGCFTWSNFTASGYNAWNYTKQLTTLSNDSYWNPIPDNMVAFSGSILDNEMLYNKDNENLKDYSFASTHYYHYLYQYFFLDVYDELKEFLSDNFKNDLTLLSANEIIEKYGTHMIHTYTTGSRLDFTYRSKIDKSDLPSDANSNDYYIWAGLNHTMRKMGYRPNGPGDSPSEDVVKRNEVPILYIENHGGDNWLIPSGTYNLQKGYPRVDIYKWEESLTEENAALVELKLEDLVPIYELVTDDSKKAEIQEAVEKYIRSRQIVSE